MAISEKWRLHLVKARAARGKGFTAAGLARLRTAAHRDRPWEHSTGPRTLLGKNVVRRNSITTGMTCAACEPWCLFTRLRITAPMEQIGVDLGHIWRVFELAPTTNGAVVADRLYVLALALFKLHRWDLALHLSMFTYALESRMAAAWVAEQDGDNG